MAAGIGLSAGSRVACDEKLASLLGAVKGAPWGRTFSFGKSYALDSARRFGGEIPRRPPYGLRKGIAMSHYTLGPRHRLRRLTGLDCGLLRVRIETRSTQLCQRACKTDPLAAIRELTPLP